MAVRIGAARIDENGNTHGGKAGDQTGKEVSIRDWYLHPKGWVLIRAKDAEARELIAECMEKGCRCDLIGYDQYQRDTLINAVRPFDFDISQLTVKVETDCSALVRVCVNYAGVPAGNFRTTDEAKVLMSTGAFDKYTDSLHCKKSTNLLRGDILVTKTQGHTVVVLDDGSNAGEEGPRELGSRLLKKGCKGTDVAELQRRLMDMAYSLPKYGADGDFGTETCKAVKAFQKDAGVDVDGEYGPITHAALMSIKEETVSVPDITEPGDAYPVKGLILDISDNQGAIKFDKLAGAVDYVIARTNMGLTTDKRYGAYAAGMRDNDIPFGCYLFSQANTADQAKAEVDLMLKMSEDTEPTMYVFDIEGSKKVTVSDKDRRAAIKAAVAYLREKTDKLIGLYTGENRFSNNLWRIQEIFDVLWIANWGKNDGSVSKVPKVPCDLHQYTSMGKGIPGIPGRVDLDRENAEGTLEKLTGRRYGR